MRKKTIWFLSNKLQHYLHSDWGPKSSKITLFLFFYSTIVHCVYFLYHLIVCSLIWFKFVETVILLYVFTNNHNLYNDYYSIDIILLSIWLLCFSKSCKNKQTPKPEITTKITTIKTNFPTCFFTATLLSITIVKLKCF